MDIVTALIGLVLIFAPAIFSFTDQVVAGWASVVAGLVVFTVAGYRVTARDEQRWEEWAAALAGLALVLAALLLRPSGAALASSVSFGLAVIVLAGLRLFALRRRATSARAHS